MTLAIIWVIGVVAAVGYSLFAGTTEAVAAAVFDGVETAVQCSRSWAGPV